MEPIAELRGNVELIKKDVDPRTTTVDKDETEASAGEKDEVSHIRGLELDRFHGGTVVLDDNGLFPKFLDVEE
ncbi:hypothetical protein V6N13_035113 [Hibiscus sabdariffa]